MSTKTEVSANLKPKGQLISRMADERGIDANDFYKALCATVMPSAAKTEDVMVFLLLCDRYDFDPFARHLFAFPGKSGGIQPVVSVDGWVNIANKHEAFDGMEYIDNENGDELVSITCKIYRKDRHHPVCCTEYMAECRGTSDPWKRWPRRMLRHKATIQAIRMAFGISGIVDEDEYERIQGCTVDAVNNKRIREVALPEPKLENTIPNGTTSHVTDPTAWRKLDLPPEAIGILTSYVNARESDSLRQYCLEGIAHSEGNEYLQAAFQTAMDSALAEIESKKPQTQKSLM